MDSATRIGDRFALTGIRPTVFFTRDGVNLRHCIDVSLVCPSVGPVALEVAGSGWREEVPLGLLPAGEVSRRAAIRDVRKPEALTFGLVRDGHSVVPHLSIDWKPVRHWEIYLAHRAHFDPGYTDLASRVMRAYDEDLDQVVDYCRETDDFPEEARFRFTIEQAAILVHYLRHRPADRAGLLLELLRQGRVDVNALTGNLVTELMGAEEMARAVQDGLDLRRRYGIPVLTAEHNDVPGISWSLATVLARSGIRYFAPGLPDYFSWGGARYHSFWDEEAILSGGAPGVFWWEGPSGARVLFHMHRRGTAGDTDFGLTDLHRRLEELAHAGYRYDALRYIIYGAMRDNAPPRIEFAGTARSWNETWAYPRLIMATNLMFFRALERQLDGSERVWRGEIPGTDYTVGALSTARETAVNRGTHDRLPAAEKWGTIAEVMGGAPSSAQPVAEAFENALSFDEHVWGIDANNGPAQEASLADKAVFAYRAAALAHDVETKALNRLADLIARTEDGFYVAAFNALDYPRTDLVEVPFDPPDPASRPLFFRPGKTEGSRVLTSAPAWGRELFRLDSSWATRRMRVVDVATGRIVDHQVVRLSSAREPAPFSAQRHARSAWDESSGLVLQFVASDVPGLGYRLLRLEPVAYDGPAEDGPMAKGPVLENRWFRIILDPGSGSIVSLVDKTKERELLDSRARHRMFELVARDVASGVEESGGVDVIRQGRLGPVSASLVVEGWAPGCPQVTREIILYRDLRRIDLAMRLLKDGDAGREFFVAFPFRADHPRFTYEAPLAVVRYLVDQLPGTNSDYAAFQHWVEMSDGTGGVTFTSPDAPLVEFGTLWPGYVSQAHHGVKVRGFEHDFLRDPGEVPSGHLYSFIIDNNFRTNFHPFQAGDLLFRYSMQPHEGTWLEGGSREHGWEACTPLVAVHLQGAVPEGLPASHGFIEMNRSSAILLALRKAEGGGLVLRFWESAGTRAEVAIRLPWWRIDEAFRAGVGEEPEESLSCSPEGFSLDIGPWDLVTVVLKGVPRWHPRDSVAIVHP